jgi:hypothetical protein
MNGDPRHTSFRSSANRHLSQTLRERLFWTRQSQERRFNLLIRPCMTLCLIRHGMLRTLLRGTCARKPDASATVADAA